MKRASKPKTIINSGKLVKYRVFGQLTRFVADAWCYGAHRSVERAVCRLRELRDLKISKRKRTRFRSPGRPEKTTSPGETTFWIEDVDANDVTRKLLTQFIHDPNNRKKKRMTVWATEEIMRRETR